MKHILIFLACSGLGASLFAQQKPIKTSGNPIFQGWYADPEGAVFENKFWVYPTYSAKYEDQVFMDAFSSPDLVKWEKHERVIDTANFKWAKKAVWAPSIIKRIISIIFYSEPMIYRAIRKQEG